MSGNFNELTRVQMPALVHLTRLGYESEKTLEDNLIKQLKADSLIKICTTLDCSFDEIVEIVSE